MEGIELSASSLKLSPSTPKVRALLEPNWLEPLRRAAQEGKRDELSGLLHTPWRNLPGPVAEFQHKAYAAQIATALYREMPELDRLLQAAGARVIVWPGCFFFGLPDNDRTGYLVDEMTPHTLLVPWACDDERAVPQ